MIDPPFQALIAAAATFVFVSALFSLLLLCRRPSKPHPSLPLFQPNPSSAADESASFDPSLPQVSMSSLAAATANFAPSHIVGDGGFGFVYKALFPSGQTVAVKRLAADASCHGFREFRAEMETLARIRHQNLARILGYCASGRDRLLVYEFLAGGSLDSRLHDPPDPDPNPLSWPARIRILRGVAAGLAFLHHDCRPCIIHRDIKASNVLLDGELEAKIADFGLARNADSSQSHVSTTVAGTMGYMPPEYREGLTGATAKADVYSFGVLMLEVVTGVRPSWPVKGEDGKEVAMVRWARGRVEEGRGLEILGVGMGREGVAEEEVVGLLGVAFRCTDDCARKRPTMKEVVSMLGQV